MPRRSGGSCPIPSASRPRSGRRRPFRRDDARRHGGPRVSVPAPEIGIAIVGAGTMAGAHSAALTMLGPLYPALPLRPRLVGVSDVNEGLATRLADRFGYERVDDDWRRLVESADVDLVVACLPPILNREVVLAAAAAGKHVVCEKPL